MNDQDLQLVLAAFKKQHPEAIEHLRALTAAAGTPVAASATPILMLILDLFDECEQGKWTMRDMLTVKRCYSAAQHARWPNGFYTIKYDAAELVKRLVAHTGLRTDMLAYTSEQPTEILNWKNDVDHHA